MLRASRLCPWPFSCRKRSKFSQSPNLLRACKFQRRPGCKWQPYSEITWRPQMRYFYCSRTYALWLCIKVYALQHYVPDIQAANQLPMYLQLLRRTTLFFSLKPRTPLLLTNNCGSFSALECSAQCKVALQFFTAAVSQPVLNWAAILRESSWCTGS